MLSTDWHTLLDWLAVAPRENGSQALATTAQLLQQQLSELGWQVTTQTYLAYPYEQRLLGVLLLVVSLAYTLAMWTRRFGLAALLPLLGMVLAYAQIELQWRLSFFASTPQDNIIATLNPSFSAEQRLILTAHYDTKTDFLDHVARAPVFALGPVFGVLAVVVALASYVGFHAGNFTAGRQTLARLLGWAGLVWGTGAFLALTGGAFLTKRSPGAMDDGAGCAVLLRLAEKLAQQPPQRTEVQLVFFSGEEISAQGSRAFVAQRQAPGTDEMPEHVVNLDPIGASLEFAVLGHERALLWSYPAHPETVRLLDRAHRRLRQTPITVLELSGLTDAWSFLRVGRKAATLFNPVPPFGIPRGLHSESDHSERIPFGALDQTLRLVEFLVRDVDRERRSEDRH